MTYTIKGWKVIAANYRTIGLEGLARGIERQIKDQKGSVYIDLDKLNREERNSDRGDQSPDELSR